MSNNYSKINIHINWEQYAKWVKDTDGNYKGLQDNFAKESALTRMLPYYANTMSDIQHIEDEYYDFKFLFPNWIGEHISAKSGGRLFKKLVSKNAIQKYQQNGWPIERVDPLHLKNTRGSHGDITSLEKSIDHLMLMNTGHGEFKVGFVPKEKVFERDSTGDYKYLKKQNDAWWFSAFNQKKKIFKAFPVSEVDIVFEKSFDDINITHPSTPLKVLQVEEGIRFMNNNA